MEPAQNSFEIPRFNALICGQAFKDHTTLIAQCRIWKDTLPENAFSSLFAEVEHAILEWLDNSQEAADKSVAALYNLIAETASKTTLSEDNSRLSRWETMAEVSGRHAERQDDHAAILERVTESWQESAQELLRLNSSLCWRGLVTKLAQQVPNYDRAMIFVSRAIYCRRLGVPDGLPCDLAPEGVDIEHAVTLSIHFPDLCQLTGEELAIGEPHYYLHLSETGLLKYGNQRDAS